MYSYIKLSRQLICFWHKKEWRKREEIHGTTSQLLNTILRIQISHYISSTIIWWMTVCLSLIMSDWNVLCCDPGLVQKVQFLSFFFLQKVNFPFCLSVLRCFFCILDLNTFQFIWLWSVNICVFCHYGACMVAPIQRALATIPLIVLALEKAKQPNWINWPSLWKAGAV